MTEANRPDAHPDAEQLAELIEGRLRGEERARVVAHLADCDECRSVFASAARHDAVVLPFWKRPKVQAVGGGVLALAASLILVVQVRPDLNPFRTPTPYEELVIAVAAGRPVEGRITGFEYGPVRSATRSETGAADYAVLAAVARLEQIARTDPSPENLRALGVGHLVAGALDPAVSSLEDAVERAPRYARANSDLATAYLARAQAGGRPEDLPRALDAAERALKDQPDLLESRFNRALILEHLNLRTSAIAAWTEYLHLDPTSGWADEARRHLDSLRRQPDVQSLDRTMRELESTAGPADSSRVKEVAATHPDHLRTALEESLSARWAQSDVVERARLAGIARAIADASTDGDTYIGDLARWMERTEPDAALRDALVQFERIAGHVRDDRFTEVAAMVGSTPGILVRARCPLQFAARYYAILPDSMRGNFAAAIPALESLRRETERAGYSFWNGVVLNRLGQIRGRQGDQEGAIALRASAVQSFASAGSEDQIAVMHSMMAESYTLLGDTSAAWMHHLEALRRIGRVDNHRSRHLILALAGLTSTRRALFGAARHFQSEVIANGLAWERPSGIATGYLQRARNLHRLEDREAALEDARAASEWIERIVDPEFRERIALELLEVEGELVDPAAPSVALAALNRAVDRFSSTGFDVRLANLLYARSEVWRAMNRYDEATADLRRGLQRLRTERTRLRGEDLRIAQGSNLRTLAHALVESRLDTAFDDETTFGLLDEARARTLVEDAVDHAAPLTSLVELQHSLPPRAILLHYSMLRAKVVLWRVDHQAARLVTLGETAPRLVALVRRYRYGLSGKGGLRIATEELSRALLEPVRDELDAYDTVIVVPDGYLHGVAYPMLLSRDGRPLVESHTVLVAPSAAFLLQRQPADRRAGAVIVGASPTTGPLAALPWAAREAQEVAAVYRKAQLAPSAVSKEGFLRSLDDARIVHFAGHAVSNPDRPLLSRLVLVDDGAVEPVYAYEIAPRNLTGAVVVLAACRTGFDDGSAEVGNEGVLSLARAFLAAKASAVIASVVDVRDAQTRDLMVHLHRALARGAAPAAALRQALTESIDRAPSGDQSWGSFVVIGNRDALETSNEQTN